MNEQDLKMDRQIKLPLKKAIEISLKSLKIRLGRSFITTTTIIFTIAFLMATFTTSVVNSVLARYGSEEIRILLAESVNEMNVRQLWLVILAFIICGLGIVNNMLMVVTERYKEIGTMKCMGALNRFVIEIFVFESIFQGLFGAVVGVFVGMLSIMILNIFNHGFFIIKYLPYNLIFLYSLVSIMSGVILSIIGVIYPAYVASKMMPADALRIEI